MNILVCILLLFAKSCLTNDRCIDWTQAKNFYFYDLPNDKTVEMISWAEIRRLRHVKINEAAPILSNAECKDTKIATWMSVYLMVVEFKDGTRKKFRVSGYGSFLAESGGRFYYIRDKDKNTWEKIIIDSRKKIGKSNQK